MASTLTASRSIPPGARIAVGYERATRVSILDARTLAPLANAETGDLSGGNLASVAWSHDGATLIGGGQAQAQFQGEGRNVLRRFDANGRRLGADVGASSDQIMDIESCSEGFVFATAEPSFGFLSPDGVARTLQGPRTANMNGKVGMAFTCLSKRRLCALRTRSRRPKLGRLRSCHRVTKGFAEPSVRVCAGPSRRPPHNGLAHQPCQSSTARNSCLAAKLPAPWLSGLTPLALSSAPMLQSALSTRRANSDGTMWAQLVLRASISLPTAN